MDRGNQTSKKKDVDWDSFEVIEVADEEEFVIRDPRLARLFHRGMIFVGLLLIFVLSGGLFWYLLNGHLSPVYTRAVDRPTGWGQFGLGGVIGLGWVLKVYFGRSR